MQQTLEASRSIDPKDLLAFAIAIRRGDFSARLPQAETDDPASDPALQLNAFAQMMQRTISEITRLTTELSQGIFGGQAEVVVNIQRGPWRECLEAVNTMEWRLTDQIRNLARTAQMLAAGKPVGPATVQCEGEMLKFKNSLNALVQRATGPK
jgi:HAMP domain-containing protein